MASDLISFISLSKKNTGYRTVTVRVANGAVFEALDLPEDELLNASNVVYLHVHHINRKCYIGVTVMRARERWVRGVGYRHNKRFGNSIEKHGWDAFDSYILSFCDNRDQLDQAEIDAIIAAGGHKTKYTYNLSPGGDMVAENDKPIVGINLETRKSFNFKSGSDAARCIGLKNSDMPMAVARKERSSVSNWWFRFEDDVQSKPPEVWGEDLRVAEIKRLKSKSVIAIYIDTNEERDFPSTAEAARQLNMRQGDVSAVAIGKQLSASGWWFKYRGDEREMPTLFGIDATRKKRDVPVYAYNLETKERAKFRNGTVAAQELGLYLTAVTGVITGKRTTAKGWWFSYDENAEPPTEFKGALVAKARRKPIAVENLNTGKVTQYDSAKTAGEAIGIHRSQISVAIKKNKPVRNYIFRFTDTDQESRKG